MKRILLAFLLASSLLASGADKYVKLTISATNLPVTSNSGTVNGIQRIFTNATTALTVATNTTIASSLTNFFNAFSTFPQSGVIRQWVNSTNMSIEGTNLTASIGGGWAYFSAVTTNAITARWFPAIPFDTQDATNRTNNASEFVYGIGLYSTNAFATNALPLLNFAARSNAVIVGPVITNAIGINGTISRLTNGYSTNLTADRIITTNLVNYGNAISSVGSGPFSEQHGTGATASGTNSLAVGYNALATKTSSMAVGNGATASGNYATAIGYGGIASGYSAISLGALGSASGSNSVTIGANADAQTYADSITIGTSALATDTNQIMLGNSTYTVNVPGRIIAVTSTNNTFTGTNRNTGDISYPRYNNTSLANGNNAGVLIGTNIFMNASGPTAAFTINGIAGGRDGKTFILQKTNSFTMTVANDSGTDPTAANRIYTGTGADITVTNNPGYVQFIYNADLTRWGILSKSN